MARLPDGSGAAQGCAENTAEQSSLRQRGHIYCANFPHNREYAVQTLKYDKRAQRVYAPMLLHYIIFFPLCQQNTNVCLQLFYNNP